MFSLQFNIKKKRGEREENQKSEGDVVMLETI